MITKEIEKVLSETIPTQEVHVAGENSHFQLIVVSEEFTGMKRLHREQMVYTPLMEYIADNRIHAVKIRAFTPAEWQKERKFLYPQ